MKEKAGESHGIIVWKPNKMIKKAEKKNQGQSLEADTQK